MNSQVELPVMFLLLFHQQLNEQFKRLGLAKRGGNSNYIILV